MVNKTPEEIKDINNSWEDHLSFFKREIYPTFASYGLTLGESIIVYENNLLRNTIYDSIDKDKDEWEKDK